MPERTAITTTQETTKAQRFAEVAVDLEKRTGHAPQSTTVEMCGHILVTKLHGGCLADRTAVGTQSLWGGRFREVSRERFNTAAFRAEIKEFTAVGVSESKVEVDTSKGTFVQCSPGMAVNIKLLANSAYMEARRQDEQGKQI